jgi:hypothetical protein
MVEYGLKELMEAFLFLIVGVMSGIAYLYFLFKKESTGNSLLYYFIYFTLYGSNFPANIGMDNF